MKINFLKDISMKIMPESHIQNFKQKFRKKIYLTFWTLNLILFLSILILPVPCFAVDITTVNVKLQNNEIHVSASVKPDPKLIRDTKEGLSKEFVFYIDLFRVWTIWPDEFVSGKKIVNILKSDPIKREYVAVSIDGNVQLEKRFKDSESMFNWAMNITDMKLTNIRGLEAGSYFVRVTLESYIRKLPPVIGYLLFFVPEKEFSIHKDSQTFSLHPQGEIK
ncbi:MAG: hypothetical protein C0415_03130 [Thermodesulfovibrio sp.]|nr:hypothetical protein [Thermodesulfovibrio sp.]